MVSSLIEIDGLTGQTKTNRIQLSKSIPLGADTGIFAGYDAIALYTGELLPADIVVIAVGVVPETALATAAGLEVRNGILTDASLRTSAALPRYCAS